MADFHFVALLTYGKEIQHGQSSFKLGRGVAADVLLRLFGSHASETTPPNASYRYIYLDVSGATTRRYYLILRLTADEKAQVETLCRSQGHSAAVYLWQDNEWLQFPCSPSAHYLYPQSYGGLYPRFPPTAAAFLTPSRSANASEAAPSENGLTVEQSGTWWWIGGDTYPHKVALKAAGARWSKRRQQWYLIGETLPATIQVLVNPPADVPEREPDTPLAGAGADSPRVVNPEVPLSDLAVPAPIPAAPPAVIEPPHTDPSELTESVPEPGEALMRSVRTDDVTAALIAHIHDSERNKPVFIDFIGSRNAVKQLLSKPFNPAYVGVKAESAAFTIVNGDNFTGFRLPDHAYKALSTALSKRVIEGRIVALDATTAAASTECYVLVMDKIALPRDQSIELIQDMWLRYVRYRQTPNRPEFAHYAPPGWTTDLYKVYQALRARIGCPLHERWMPWLFEQVTDKPVSSEKSNVKGVTLCKYIPGYLDPKALGMVECGAYRLTCRNLSKLWAELLIRNPNRAEGISFGSAE